MKQYIMEVTLVFGEQEQTCKGVIRAVDMEDAEKQVHETLLDFYGEDNCEYNSEDNVYLWIGGQVGGKKITITEIPLPHYNVLKKYLWTIS